MCDSLSTDRYTGFIYAKVCHVYKKNFQSFWRDELSCKGLLINDLCKHQKKKKKKVHHYELCSITERRACKLWPQSVVSISQTIPSINKKWIVHSEICFTCFSAQEWIYHLCDTSSCVVYCLLVCSPVRAGGSLDRLEVGWVIRVWISCHMTAVCRQKLFGWLILQKKQDKSMIFWWYEKLCVVFIISGGSVSLIAPALMASALL